jgi:GTP cyclohydrolase IA
MTTKLPIWNKLDLKRAQSAIRELLIALGEDPEREGLKDTPRRVVEMYQELLAGMAVDPMQEIRKYSTINQDEMIIVKDIPFSSICEHHLLPFIGHAHIVYIPREGKVAGISKLARMVDAYSKRLQVQEIMTSQIADTITGVLDAKGVLVVIEAEHLCMTIRGVKKPGSKVITSAVRGVLRNLATREEALALMKNH